MPANPSWIARIPLVVKELEALPRPFVDRSTLELLLGVSRRRAQQILAPASLTASALTAWRTGTG
jgi:hypothetical protein